MANEVVSWTYDTLEPSQWFGGLYGQRLDDYDGLQRLSRAVLLNAVYDASGRRLGSDNIRKNRNEALSWFATDSRVEPFSFANVCETLGLDRELVRAKLGGRLRGLRHSRRGKLTRLSTRVH